MNTTSGAGRSGAAPAGSTSQDRSRVPSPAVGLDLGQRAGHGQGQAGRRQRAGPLVGGGGVQGDRLGGAAMVARRAYSRRPSGVGAQVGEGAVGADSRVTRRRRAATSTRNTGVRPSSSATKNTARLSAAQTGSGGHRSRPAGRSRPSPAGQVDQPQADVAGAGRGRRCRPRADHRAGRRGSRRRRPTEVAGSSSSTRRSPLATSIATSSERGLPTSPVSQPVTTVAPSGVTATSTSSRARPGRRGQRPARRRPLVGRRRGGREQPRLPRAQVVVPVADRVGLEQLRADPGVVAGLVAALVGLQVVGPGVDAGARTPPCRRRGPPRSRSIPAGGSATRRASPPPAGSSHRRATSPSGLGVGRRPRGRARAEVNSSDPSGRKAALASPGAERVSRRGAASPAGSSSHRALRTSCRRGPAVATEVTRRAPSGERARPATRGRAQVMVEVEGRLGARVGGHSPESRCPAAAAQRHRQAARVLDITVRFGYECPGCARPDPPEE